MTQELTTQHSWEENGSPPTPAMEVEGGPKMASCPIWAIHLDMSTSDLKTPGKFLPEHDENFGCIGSG
jgi:hypothetical protein